MMRLCFLNTNARSLCPKVESLIDCMNETDSHLAIIMESWLREGAGLEKLREDLELGAGMCFLTKNRLPE